jgi:septin family protein
VFEEYKKEFQKRYKSLHRHLLLNSQKSFVQRLDSHIEDKKAWLSSLAQSLIGRTLEKFKDEDELMLYDKFSEMILSLDSLNRISKSRFDQDKEIALDVQINSFGEEMASKVIRLPKNKSKQVEKLEENIKELLSKDKTIDLVAIANVLKDLL